MKYLKKYESYDSDESKKSVCLALIKHWLINNKLNSVDISDYNIQDIYKFGDDDIEVYTVNKIIFEKGWEIGILEIITALIYEYLWQRFEKGKETVNYIRTIRGANWSIDCLNKIVDVLNNMTPEEIEEQRANNEAEKFNM